MDREGELSAKERIMAAAVALTDERSAQFVKLRDIARTAGVSPSLILFHFKSREDLILEARFMAYEAGRAREIDLELQNGPAKPLADLVLFLASGDMVAGHKVRDFMAMSWWRSIEDEARFGRCLNARETAYRRSFSLLDPPLSEAKIEALSVMATRLYIGVLREGAVLSWPPPQQVADKVTRLLLAAAQA
jgi:AcrR family transcriptional regulator